MAVIAQSSYSTSVEATKDDLSLLLNVLGLQRPGNHCGCRFCGNRDSLSIFKGDSGWAFNCHRCGAAGDVIDAVALAEGCRAGEAMRRLGVERPARSWTWNQPSACKPEIPAEPDKPVADQERIQTLMEAALVNVWKGHADKWIAKRGLQRDFLNRHPILGFFERVSINSWAKPLRNAWAILVSDADATYRAVKFHLEEPGDGPKCLWAPFGTFPAEKPKHAFATFWPCPEWLERNDWIYLCPGELKAAAVRCAGRDAISITTGESFTWTRWHVARLRGRRIVILYDDDPAGHQFRDKSIAALGGHVAELRASTFGRKGNA